MKEILTLIWNTCKLTVQFFYYLPVALFLFGVLEGGIASNIPQQCPLRRKIDDFLDDLTNATGNPWNEVKWHTLTVVSAIILYGTVAKIVMNTIEFFS